MIDLNYDNGCAKIDWKFAAPKVITELNAHLAATWEKMVSYALVMENARDLELEKATELVIVTKDMPVTCVSNALWAISLTMNPASVQLVINLAWINAWVPAP